VSNSLMLDSTAAGCLPARGQAQVAMVQAVIKR
jgi:hypothetical protein